MSRFLVFFFPLRCPFCLCVRVGSLTLTQFFFSGVAIQFDSPPILRFGSRCKGEEGHGRGCVSQRQGTCHVVFFTRFPPFALPPQSRTVLVDLIRKTQVLVVLSTCYCSNVTDWAPVLHLPFEQTSHPLYILTRTPADFPLSQTRTLNPSLIRITWYLLILSYSSTFKTHDIIFRLFIQV